MNCVIIYKHEVHNSYVYGMRVEREREREIERERPKILLRSDSLPCQNTPTRVAIPRDILLMRQPHQRGHAVLKVD